MRLSSDTTLAIIGLGYVGLPLAVAFGQRYETVGYDISRQRIEELKSGCDHTRETTDEERHLATELRFSCAEADLVGCDVYIVTVPTPVDAHKKPDLTALLGASETVGRTMSRGAIVIYESTVYPGATEEDCVPVLELTSGLRFNQDFFVGYSPERINPGDKHHRLTDIVKVTAGSTPEVAEVVDALYASVVRAGTHRAPSIRVAEAAKVIENTQRDVNIALINELALIFDRLDIDTADVLAAAGTKWNFLPFRPGLVGGHCIGIDPYYLTHRAQAAGYHPEVVLAGRRLNDGMGQHVARKMVREMIGREIPVHEARVLVLGLTFKENCPDLRNTRVLDVIEELQSFSVDVFVYDPWVALPEARAAGRFHVLSELPNEAFEGVLLAVAHDSFKDLTSEDLRRLRAPKSVVYDLKAVLPRDVVDLRL